MQIRVGLTLLLVGMAGCTRESGKMDSASGAKSVSAVTLHPAESIPIPPAPTTWVFVGEVWAGKTASFAIRDTASHSSAWYHVGDKIGNYEIIGLLGGSLLLRSGNQSLLLPLTGLEISRPASDAASGNALEAKPTVTVWADGKGVEATADRMPPELLKMYNDSKEALLAVKVPAELEPMIAQALDSKVVVIASGKDGFKRSDFPADISAKLGDATLAKINAALKAPPAAAGRGQPPK